MGDTACRLIHPQPCHFFLSPNTRLMFNKNKVNWNKRSCVPFLFLFFSMHEHAAQQDPRKQAGVMFWVCAQVQLCVTGHACANMKRAQQLYRVADALLIRARFTGETQKGQEESVNVIICRHKGPLEIHFSSLFFLTCLDGIPLKVVTDTLPNDPRKKITSCWRKWYKIQYFDCVN